MQLKFDEVKHEYRVGNTLLVSVTDFVKEFFEPFDEDSASRYVADRDGKTQEQVLREWRAKRDWGDHIHKLIENRINGKVKKNYEKEVIDAISFIESIPHKKIIPEMKVYSMDWRIAGTVDAVIDNPEGVTLIDWKTTSNLKMDNPYQKAKSPISHLDDCNYVRYLLQLNMYKAIFEKQHGKKVTNMYFVTLSNQEQSLYFPVVDLSHEIDLMLKKRSSRRRNS